MNSFYTSVCLFFISILFIQCSPIPVEKVYLQEADIGYWQKGQGIGEKKLDDVVVEAVYSHSDKEYTYFDVAFENVGTNRITLNPRDFRLHDANGGIQQRAIDPELMILSMEVNQSKKEANNKTLALVAGTVIVAGTVAAIATSDGSSTDSGDDVDEDCIDDNYVFVNHSPRFGAPVEYLYFSQEPILSTNHNLLPRNDALIFWQEYTIRRSTVFPDQRIRGLVAFRKLKNIDKSRLIIPIGENEVSFDFVHRTY